MSKKSKPDDIDDILDLPEDPTLQTPPPINLETYVRMRTAEKAAAGNPLVVTDEHGVRRFKGYVIPATVQRVKVTDSKGQNKLRRVEDLGEGDTLCLTTEGTPIFIERQVGRPPDALSQVLPPSTPLQADLLRIKEGHLRSDAVIQTLETDPESLDVLQQVMLAIGEEAASMRFERMEAERKGEDTSTLSMRRVQAMKALGDTYLKRKEQIANKSIDLDSPTFRALFEFLCETFTKAMQATGLRDEQCDTVMSQFAKMLDDTWKNEAKNRMKK